MKKEWDTALKMLSKLADGKTARLECGKWINMNSKDYEMPSYHAYISDVGNTYTMVSIHSPIEAVKKLAELLGRDI